MLSWKELTALGIVVVLLHLALAKLFQVCINVAFDLSPPISFARAFCLYVLMWIILGAISVALRSGKDD